MPKTCIETVHRHLRAVGQQGHEGFGLWAGRMTGSRFQVTEAVIPRQRHIRTSDGVCVVLEGDELHRLNVHLFHADLMIIAQIHSHPGRAYHSDTDDANSVATAVGCLSLVVPDFARGPFDLRTAAAYRLDARGVWRALDRSATRWLVTVVD